MLGTEDSVASLALPDEGLEGEEGGRWEVLHATLPTRDEVFCYRVSVYVTVDQALRERGGGLDNSL